MGSEDVEFKRYWRIVGGFIGWACSHGFLSSAIVVRCAEVIAVQRNQGISRPWYSKLNFEVPCTIKVQFDYKFLQLLRMKTTLFWRIEPIVAYHNYLDAVKDSTDTYQFW